jgi:SAM-dependent methyltransferase
MGDHHTHRQPPEELILSLERQEVTVDDFEAQGWVLDIGGGGEGIIGRLKGEQVVAIDRNIRELEEAPDGPLKVVMDASKLEFLDASFNVVTGFFSLMYMVRREETLHRRVFEEVFRVLAPGGRFLIWDAVLPERLTDGKEYAFISLLARLPEEEVETGYGVLLPEEEHDLSYYIRLAESVGFEAGLHKDQGQTFYLELIKPAS